MASRKIVWKVHGSHRLDLTTDERRARQKRLIAPIAAVKGLQPPVFFVGLDADIAALQSTTSRIYAVDAVGWDLFEQLQSQKRYLDEIAINALRNPRDPLARAYLKITQLGRWAVPWFSVELPPNTALIVDSPRPGPFRLKTKNLSAAQKWLYGLARIVFECTLNAAGLALDQGHYYLSAQASKLAFGFLEEPTCDTPMPKQMLAFAKHILTWFPLMEGLFDGPVSQTNFVGGMGYLEVMLENEFPDDVFMLEDLDIMKRLVVRLLFPPNDCD